MTAPLPALQRWFQKGVVAPRDVDAVKEILPSRTLTPQARIELYADMYFVRLHEALANDFKTLKAVLGDAAFRRLCRDYLVRHPSRHYSLNPIGRKLPDFLRTSRLPKRALLADLARLECDMSEVFDEEACESVAPAVFAAIPPARLSASRLRFIPAFRLLTLDHPVNALVTAVRRGDRRPRTPRRIQHLAVYRKEHVVWRMELTATQHALLRALLAGRPVGRAVSAALAAWKGTPAAFERELFKAFREFSAEGFFAKIR